MSNTTQTNETTQSTWEHCKNFCSLLKQKKFWAALREFFNIFKSFYLNHLKGKYLNIGGHKIPMTAILLVVLIGIYYAIHASFGANSASGKSYIADNTYDKDGLKVYDLKNCSNNMAACGLVENGSEKNYERIRVKLVFYDRPGKPIAVGIADALEMAPRTRVQFQIPCEDEFAYFKLDDVLINPDIDEEELEKEKAQQQARQRAQQQAETEAEAAAKEETEEDAETTEQPAQ